MKTFSRDLWQETCKTVARMSGDFETADKTPLALSWKFAETFVKKLRKLLHKENLLFSWLEWWRLKNTKSELQSVKIQSDRD